MGIDCRLTETLCLEFRMIDTVRTKKTLKVKYFYRIFPMLLKVSS